MDISFKDIYDLRNYILTVRFFLLFVSSFFTIFYVVPVFKIDSLYFVYSLLGVALSYLFSEMYIRFKQKLQYAKDLHIQNDFEREYKIYNELLSEILWSSERFKVNLYLSMLFYKIGNFKRFIEIMDKVSLDIEKYPKEKYLYGFLKAFYFEINLDFSKAISELESVSENTTDINLKLQAYNNIARIEEMEGNSVSALSFYEKAFEILKKKPEAKFFPIVIHNILISYGKQNELEKGANVLKVYWDMIDKINPQQIIEYANDMTHYGRQIKNKDLLEKSHDIIKDKVVPLLKDDRNLILELSQLRMRYNDDIEFDKYFKMTFYKLKLQKNTFSVIEKLNIIREFRYVLQQKIGNGNQDFKWVEDFNWIINWHLSLRNEIEEQLKNIESSLSIIRIFWIKQLIDLQKSKMAFPKNIQEPIDMNDLTVLVEYIKEMIRIWEDVKNTVQQINEIFHLMDELFNYWNQTKDVRIIHSYKEEINVYLNKADSLLEKYWRIAPNKEFLIAMSWFFLNLQQNQEKAFYWLNRFDGLKISLNHYAQYIVIWYNTVKKVQDDTYSMRQN
jgi:hypothetical protein